MTKRQLDVRSQARALGLRVKSTRSRLTFEHPGVKAMWDKLRKNASQADSKESRDAMTRIIDEYGKQVWGKYRAHLLKVGEVSEYQMDLRWPRDREQVLKLAHEMRGEEILRNKSAGFSKGLGAGPSKSKAVLTPEMISAASKKKIVPLSSKSGPIFPNLKHVEFWLVSIDEGLLGRICPETYTTVQVLFNAIGAAMIREETSSSGNRTVDRITISGSRLKDKGCVSKVITAQDGQGMIWPGFRRSLSSVVGKDYNTEVGEKLICFVDVSFKNDKDFDS